MTVKLSYSIDELLINFKSIIEGMDFPQKLLLLTINPFRFKKRRLATQHLHALTLGLWRLALQRSFPSDYNDIFNEYFSRKELQTSSYKKYISSSTFQTMIQTYISLLDIYSDKNFTEVSSYLIKTVHLPKINNDVVRLKLALTIRNMYNFIFKSLI